MPTVILTAEVKVNGADPPVAADLISARVEKSLWMPARAVVRYDDYDFALTDSSTFTVGTTMTISMPKPPITPTGSPTLVAVFDGEITDVTVEQGTSGSYELVVGAMDKSHRLAVATTVKTFANQTYQAMVQSVISEAGLTADVTIDGGATIPYALQSTSAYAFLWDVALRTGCEWWAEGSTVHFKKRAETAGPTVTSGEDLHDLRVRYSGATRPNKVTVRGWDSATQAAITGDDSGVLTSSTVPGIGSTAGIATSNRTGSAGWGKAVVATGLTIADAAEATAVADAIAARIDAGELLATGVAQINPDIKVGEMLTVAGMGVKISGDYLVTSVEHIVSQTRVETRFTAGNKAPVGLADLVGGREPSAPRWGGLGLVTGVVTAVTQDPDGAARIKVKFPALSDEDESAWARLVAPGAGSGVGIQWTPEINDEVVVGFENGDVRYPVVIGGIWSAKNLPPVSLADSGPVISRMMKSKLGHQLELSDGSGDDKKHILLQLADGTNKFRLGADKTDLEIASGKVFTIKSGSAKITIDAQGGITIEGGAVNIKATQDLSLKGMNVKINADLGVTIQAGTELKATASAQATLDGGGMMNVKGGMVKIN